MNERHRLSRLGQVLDLRKREVDQLSSEMAGKRLVRQRYLDNLARLEQLCKSSGPSGAQRHAEGRRGMSSLLSLNCGSYKQAVLKMAEAHRLDLSLHEAQMVVTQRSMTEAARRHAALEQALARRRDRAARQQALQEQKRQDDLAAQVWLRRQK